MQAVSTSVELHFDGQYCRARQRKSRSRIRELISVSCVARQELWPSFNRRCQWLAKERARLIECTSALCSKSYRLHLAGFCPRSSNTGGKTGVTDTLFGSRDLTLASVKHEIAKSIGGTRRRAQATPTTAGGACGVCGMVTLRKR